MYTCTRSRRHAWKQTRFDVSTHILDPSLKVPMARAEKYILELVATMHFATESNGEEGEGEGASEKQRELLRYMWLVTRQDRIKTSPPVVIGPIVEGGWKEEETEQKRVLRDAMQGDWRMCIRLKKKKKKYESAEDAIGVMKVIDT